MRAVVGPGVDRVPQVGRPVGRAGSSVCWDVTPVFARYRSSRPGATAFAIMVAAVDAPTQYSRRFGWSPAYTMAFAATSGW